MSKRKTSALRTTDTRFSHSKKTDGNTFYTKESKTIDFTQATQKQRVRKPVELIPKSINQEKYILSLLDDKSDQTRLNTIQLITNVGEYPPAKEKFKECLEKLGEIVKAEEEDFPLNSRFAASAIKNITWKA